MTDEDQPAKPLEPPPEDLDGPDPQDEDVGE